jgi:hypothetical protein
MLSVLMSSTRRHMVQRIFALFCALIAFAPVPALAQELLVNRSFESAVTPTPVNGNNFYATIPNWTVVNVTPAQATPWNIIRPHAGYANNPTATPTGGGSLYLDINAASGTIRQTVTFPSAGMVDISGWFSVRDFSQALGGLVINVRNVATNNVVATTNTSFVATDPIGLWKQAAATNLPVAAGAHIFEVEIPNFANFDLASLVFKPALTVTKTSTAFSDGVSATNPKLIAGAVAEYTLSATSPASYTVTSNSIILSDATPANMALVVSDIGGSGSGPSAFTAGTSSLTYTFTSLGNAADDIEFSNNGGASWTYTPVIGANGTDTAVTNVRLRPKGTMAASSTLSFRIRYRIN